MHDIWIPCSNGFMLKKIFLMEENYVNITVKCKKTFCIHSSRLYFSGASNLRSFQDKYLKCAENVGILVHIVYAKFYNF